MLKRAGALAAAALMAGTLSVQAQQDCGGYYTVKRGDTLSLIADRLYQNAARWTVIYRSNAEIIASPDSIRVGQTYRMPCIEGLPVGLGGTGAPTPVVREAVAPAPRPAAPAVVPAPADEAVTRTASILSAPPQGMRVRLLAADDFRPFTNRLLMSSGLITDIVNRALVASDGIAEHEFFWVNDRRAHLDPMLSEGMADLAFPWRKPDCDAQSTAAVCTDYLYSEQMFEMLVVLFTAKDRPITYRAPTDLAGLRVCAPLGHDTQARYGQGADYLARAGARLQQPERAEDCFNRLHDGVVDAVAMNEFTGRVVLKDMGLSDAVSLQLGRPLAIEGLHAVAHRSNPNAEEMIAAFDRGLARIRQSGEYLTVLDQHMSSIWEGL
ncbi:transporter substrate-binding domain-containing protein [Cognatishimia sp. F0-27]|uniref:LysM peptidoglycan-binding domain-containing protein n=1 Tax=Cognatishimia sp. F0-27 TaxID=2816855 RepID=UPI001D0C137A|nr:transporter substrate-binding domain-containing protein [Cognatishimia sp. F0-27]MCC1494792.1 transporter substrate-binding domain-containing protein [Cognatishimia sp. F0-27]